MSSAYEEGTPQGGPLSPLLSNIMLNELDKELARRGHPFVRYADDSMIFCKTKRAAEADCLIIDCYGLLSSIYRYATIAYVGGGFGVGIHNVPEAAVYGVPVIIGPNNKKFREAQALLQCGGCIEVHSPNKRAGIRAITTNDIIRLESMASCMDTPDLEVAEGTRRNDSKPSNTERSGFNLPPSSNCGLILSR